MCISDSSHCPKHWQLFLNKSKSCFAPTISFWDKKISCIVQCYFDCTKMVLLQCVVTEGNYRLGSMKCVENLFHVTPVNTIYLWLHWVLLDVDKMLTINYHDLHSLLCKGFLNKQMQGNNIISSVQITKINVNSDTSSHKSSHFHTTLVWAKLRWTKLKSSV